MMKAKVDGQVWQQIRNECLGGGDGLNKHALQVWNMKILYASVSFSPLFPYLFRFWAVR